MRIIVTGSSGMLGTAIQEVLSSHQLFAFSHKDLDVRKYWDIRTIKFGELLGPDLIIHLAAVTDHHDSEVNWENTYLTNTIGTHNMVDLARMYNIPIVYISSCSEYDGSVPAHREDEQLDPINHYSISKYYGDIAVKSWHKHYILRAGWMYGGGIGLDKKFLAALIWPLIQKGEKKIPAITDSVGNPTYTYDLARTIKNIVDVLGALPYGTYNVGGLGEASRWDTARAFVDYLGLDVEIIPMTTIEFHKKWPMKVIYHKRAVMDLSKIQNSGFSAMRPWKEALRDYVEKSFKNI